MKVISRSEEKTLKIAGDIAKKIINGGFVYLFGDLGSGKTIFTKGIAKALGMDHFSVKSPTYTYIRKYEINGITLYHVDLYRLDSIDELLLGEMEEIGENPKNIIIIEWADKMGNRMDKNSLKIYFEYIDKNTRKITVKNDNFRN